jgi:hypothetical protein
VQDAPPAAQPSGDQPSSGQPDATDTATS